MSWEAKRSEQLKVILDQLISSYKYSFNEGLHKLLPDLPGLYAISIKDKEEGEYLRAGRTDEGGLRQRIYQNHLMGNQKGNLRSQLVEANICANLEGAKTWIKDHCQVQWIVIHNNSLRRWSEHYILSILRPHLSD